jgi:arginine decarboxylase
LNRQTYSSYVQERYARASEGPLTDFLSRRNGLLYLDDRIVLNDLARRYGTPLEVAYYPQIANQIQRMQTWIRKARMKTGYSGQFHYAYATKANFAADVVQTALAAGAHYETSAAPDVEIARHLWRQGILSPDRLVCCNGSKEPAYLDAIYGLRQDGCRGVIAIVDDLDEVAALSAAPFSFSFGVRERAVGNRDGSRPGNDRFGMTPQEIGQMVNFLEGSHHQLVLYHAMVGTQIEDSDYYLQMLHDSIASYCALRQRVPTLRYFNIGGGMPTAGYRLDFAFDYKRFFTRLMSEIQETCRSYGVPVPELIGEFGRYTVATHSLQLFEVGKVKAGQNNEPDWYMVNGSLMVSMPDMVMVPNQQFIVLPLDGWNAPVRPVRLAGRRTCDSDDVYPRPPREPLMLPDKGEGMVLVVLGLGAYQHMLAGVGGVHHCLCPEPRRLVIREEAGQTTFQSRPPQDQAAIMRLLGYQPERMVQPVRTLEQRKAS